MTDSNTKFIITNEVGIPKNQRTNKTKTKRFVCLSDTFLKHSKFKNLIPEGDFLIFCGNFSKNLGQNQNTTTFEIKEFHEFLSKLPHSKKIFIGGTEEIYFNQIQINDITNMFKDCIYLQDNSFIFEGNRIYGFPWSEIQSKGFYKNSQEFKKELKKIPVDTDILITNIPPYNILDLIYDGEKDESLCEICNQKHKFRRHCGDLNLLKEVYNIKPKVHIFGHVSKYN